MQIVALVVSFALVVAFVTPLCAEDGFPSAGVTAQSRGGMVVSVSRPATQVGAAILEQGGNAVDAAVAVAFALAVTWPEAGNIGGGGFMLIYPNQGGPTVMDYREKAPATATVDMFAHGRDHSYLMVGVPGIGFNEFHPFQITTE
jgi:gamma-glutamyltranspeptidase/glutathione hydrolase